MLSFFSSRGGGEGAGGNGGGLKKNVIEGIKHFCSTASKKKSNGYV